MKPKSTGIELRTVDDVLVAVGRVRFRVVVGIRLRNDSITAVGRVRFRIVVGIRLRNNARITYGPAAFRSRSLSLSSTISMSSEWFMGQSIYSIVSTQLVYNFVLLFLTNFVWDLWSRGRRRELGGESARRAIACMRI